MAHALEGTYARIVSILLFVVVPMHLLFISSRDISFSSNDFRIILEERY